MSEEMNECKTCLGSGIEFLQCCNQFDCGCRGAAVAAKQCKCGKEFNKDALDESELEALEHIQWLGD